MGYKTVQRTSHSGVTPIMLPERLTSLRNHDPNLWQRHVRCGVRGT
jgi:hypothetical protein